MSLDKDGFQIVLNIILPQVENEKLKALIENKFKFKPIDVNEYSILFASLSNYISSGFSANYNHFLLLAASSTQISYITLHHHSE